MNTGARNFAPRGGIRQLLLPSGEGGPGDESPQTASLIGAATEHLNSECFRRLRDLLSVTREERAALAEQLSVAFREADIFSQRYTNWQRGSILKRLFPRSFAKWRNASETAAVTILELQQKLRLTRFPFPIEIEPAHMEPYFRMRDAFASVCRSQRIWDTATSSEVPRQQVVFSLRHCDLIQWDLTIPNLPNHAGGNLFLYPGFVVYRASSREFALIDCKEVTIECGATDVVDDEEIPTEAITSHTWQKCNKDGSQDRRFSVNRQIPIGRYAVLNLTTATGLHEQFQLSNVASAECFAESWRAFQASVSNVTAVKRAAASAS